MPLLDLSQALTQNQGLAKGTYNKITSRHFIMADYYDQTFHDASYLGSVTRKPYWYSFGISWLTKNYQYKIRLRWRLAQTLIFLSSNLIDAARF